MPQIAPDPAPDLPDSKAPSVSSIRKADPVVAKPIEFTDAEQKLIDDWAEANEMCRGSSEVALVELWCPRREVATKKMNRAGICYGHEDDASGAENDIHRCRAGSYR
jgi:hypothetical protein